jgi:serine/threonine-protein kinase HipA
MTKRFDRMGQGQKVHMQSLCAMRHFDFNTAHAYSYEQAIETGRLLQLPRKDLEQQVRRAYFNVIIRNQDDHTKNIAYLMDRSGKWTLSPAFDVVYAYNPSGSWTSQHQMSINGKATNFSEDDLIALASYADIGKRRAQKMLAEIRDVVMSWEHYAERARMSENHAKRVKNGFRLRLK